MRMAAKMASGERQPPEGRNAARQLGAVSGGAVPRRAYAPRSPLIVGALALSLFITSPLRAQSEPIGRQPYDLHLVILLGDHRFLGTEAFQDQFPRDLVQQTKLALGSLVQVDAATTHPLAEAIARDGLGAIDHHEEVLSRRTWFFVVRFHEGQFHVDGRFFDGLTGLAGPPARTISTSDRSRLAHLAARMIAESFPLVGTVTSAKGDAVDLALHGGQLNDVVHLPRGAVFAVSRITSAAGKLRATRLPFAVLETKAPQTNGVVACQFWHRFQESKIVRGEGVVYRALVLPTRSAALSLQVIDQETSQPLAGIGVKIGGGVKREVELVTDAAGLAVTPDKVSNLAIVALSQGGATFAQFPVPIVDERRVVAVVSTNPKSENQLDLDIRRQQLRVHILNTLQVVDQRISEQGVLLRQSLEKSLEHAKATIAFLDREIADIQSDRDEIRQLAKIPANSRFEELGDKGLARLRELRGIVDKSTTSIAHAIVERDVRTVKHNMGVKLIEQAALLESQARIDEALDTYQKAVDLLPNPEKVVEKLKTLRAAWDVKNKDHEQARKFLLDTWPQVDVALIQEHLALAERSLNVCQTVDDRLTPKRFLIVSVDHLARIDKITTKLARSRTADDRKKVEAWNATVGTIRRLLSQASEQISAKKQP